MLAVGDVTEAVLGDAQQVDIVFALQDLAQSLAAGTVQSGVSLFHAVEQEGQGDHVEPLVEGRPDQIGVHGQLGGAVHQGLDAVGLAAGGQLVSGIVLNGDGTAGLLAHDAGELLGAVHPGRGLGSGAGELPGHGLELAGGGVTGAGIAGARISGVAAAAAGHQGQRHGQRQEQCKKLFHGFASLK